MKRARSHATRRIFGLNARRRSAVRAVLRPQRLFAALQLGSKSVLSLSLAGLIMILIGLLMVNFVSQVMQSARLEARRIELEAEVAELTAENVRHAGRAEYVESDVYAELVARGQLSYAYEGDTVVLTRVEPVSIPIEPEPEPTAEPEPAPPQPQIENWRLWWQAFFPPAVAVQ
jgi:cell division protein FtsB